MYGKQESRTRVKSNFAFFDKVDYNAVKAKNEGKSLTILGDLNVAIGDDIKGNHLKISTGRGESNENSEEKKINHTEHE